MLLSKERLATRNLQRSFQCEHGSLPAMLVLPSGSITGGLFIASLHHILKFVAKQPLYVVLTSLLIVSSTQTLKVPTQCTSTILKH